MLLDRIRQIEIVSAPPNCEICLNPGAIAVAWWRMNLFPNFTPQPLFRLLRSLEPTIEASPGLRALCTVQYVRILQVDFHRTTCLTGLPMA